MNREKASQSMGAEGEEEERGWVDRTAEHRQARVVRAADLVT